MSPLIRRLQSRALLDAGQQAGRNHRQQPSPSSMSRLHAELEDPLQHLDAAEVPGVNERPEQPHALSRGVRVFRARNPRGS
jgi:hypothetical protein